MRAPKVFGWPEGNPSGIRLIDSLDLADLQSSQTRTLYTEICTSPFTNKTPQAINETVRSQFPRTNLNCVHFIILDSITSQNQTCILGDNQVREDPFLMLVRSDFRSAMVSVVCATFNGFNFEVMSETAAEEDGISRI